MHVIDKNSYIRFSALFIFTCAIAYLAVNFMPLSVHEKINTHTARITSYLLKLLTIEVTTRSALLLHHDFSVKIITECTGLYVMILFAAFSLTFPASFKSKVTGIPAGLGILYLANLIRLVILFMVGLMWRTAFDYAHVYLGQLFMFLATITVSLLWLRYATDIETNDSPIGLFFRVIAYTFPLIILWFVISKPYVASLLNVSKFILSLFTDNAIHTNKQLRLFPHTFDTFNIVIFWSLVLSTHALNHSQKRIAFLSGSLVLSVTHLLVRLFKSSAVLFHLKSSFFLSILFLVLNQWIFPFMLWLMIVYTGTIQEKELK